MGVLKISDVQNIILFCIPCSKLNKLSKLGLLFSDNTGTIIDVLIKDL